MHAMQVVMAEGSRRVEDYFDAIPASDTRQSDKLKQLNLKIDKTLKQLQKETRKPFPESQIKLKTYSKLLEDYKESYKIIYKTFETKIEEVHNTQGDTGVKTFLTSNSSFKTEMATFQSKEREFQAEIVKLEKHNNTEKQKLAASVEGLVLTQVPAPSPLLLWREDITRRHAREKTVDLLEAPSNPVALWYQLFQNRTETLDSILHDINTVFADPNINIRNEKQVRDKIQELIPCFEKGFGDETPFFISLFTQIIVKRLPGLAKGSWKVTRKMASFCLNKMWDHYKLSLSGIGAISGVAYQYEHEIVTAYNSFSLWDMAQEICNWASTQLEHIMAQISSSSTASTTSRVINTVVYNILNTLTPFFPWENCPILLAVAALFILFIIVDIIVQTVYWQIKNRTRLGSAQKLATIKTLMPHLQALFSSLM